MRPASSIYAVDEVPPALRLLLLALQYAVMIAIYPVLVVIVLRHAHVTEETRVGVIGMAVIAAAIGTVLQGLPRGPGFPCPTRLLCRWRLSGRRIPERRRHQPEAPERRNRQAL